MNPILLIGVVAVVVLVVLVLRQRSGGGKPKKKDNEFRDTTEKRSSSTRVEAAPEPTSEGLPTWGGLDAWSPEAGEDAGYGTEGADEGDLVSWDSGTTTWESGTEEESWGSDTVSWETEGTEATEAEPALETWASDDTWGDDSWSSGTLSEGTDLDSEFEETFGSGGFEEPAEESAGLSPFSFSSAPSPINEEVSTADDIMAASAATELHLGGGGEAEEAGPAENSELAKLLAKVQARLSAYE